MSENKGVDIQGIVYTLIKDRINKYGTFSKQNILNSTFYYSKQYGLSVDVTIVNKLIDNYEKQKSHECLDLSGVKSKSPDPFKIQDSSPILRFAACPNLSPTLFNLKGLAIHKHLCLTNTIKKMYIRFDDTNPNNKATKLHTYRSYKEAARMARSRCPVYLCF